MRRWRFDSETSKLFPLEDSSEVVRIKNVVERSVLRRRCGAQSAEEHERESSALIESKKARPRSRDLAFCIGGSA
jgi:hypothetical protein